MWVQVRGEDRTLLILALAGTMLPLLTLTSDIPAVLLVRREKTFPSMRRSDLLDGCGDEGGVVSEDVALSTELDLVVKVKLFFLLITGEGLGLAGEISLLLRLGEAEGNLDVLFCLGGNAFGGGIKELSVPFMAGADMDITIGTLPEGGGGLSLTNMIGVSSGVSITGLRTGNASSLPAYSSSSGVVVRRRARELRGNECLLLGSLRF